VAIKKNTFDKVAFFAASKRMWHSKSLSALREVSHRSVSDIQREREGERVRDREKQRETHEAFQ
jgi:hypothetical protein